MTHCQFLRLLYFPADLSSPEDFIPNLYANMQIMLTRDKYIITSQPQHRTEHILKRYFSKKSVKVSAFFLPYLFSERYKNILSRKVSFIYHPSIIHLSHPVVFSDPDTGCSYLQCSTCAIHCRRQLSIKPEPHSPPKRYTQARNTGTRMTKTVLRMPQALGQQMPKPWATSAQASGPSTRCVLAIAADHYKLCLQKRLTRLALIYK